MLRSRTTTLPPKDLVRPSTSTAMAPVVASAAGMADTRGLLQGDGYGLADAHVGGPLRNSLDSEYQPCTLLQAVDHGWGELGLRRNEIHPCHQAGCAAITADRNPVADVHLRQRCLGHKEAHPDVLGRQQRHNGPTGRHHLADAKVNLLNGAGDGAGETSSLEARARRVEPRLGAAQRRFRVVEYLLRADRLLQELLRAVEGDLGVGYGCLIFGNRCALQVGIEREQGRANGDRIALAHRQRLHASRLVGAHENEVGLDPTFERAHRHPVAEVDVGGSGNADRRHSRESEEDLRPGGPHDASFPVVPVRTWRCARSKAPTSSGSIWANSPSQSTATSNGATMSWGNRAGASLANAPSWMARSASARSMPSPWATTSR